MNRKLELTENFSDIYIKISQVSEKSNPQPENQTDRLQLVTVQQSLPVDREQLQKVHL